MAERNRLSGFAQANELLKKRFAGDAKIILDECLDRRALTKEAVMKALNKAYYLHRLQDFASKNGLNQIASFSVREHRKMLRSFAEADVRVLEGSPTRLYDLLSTRLEQEAVSRKGKSRVGLGKIESHVGFASRDTILANFDFIKVIKPCFMMSPLNVSQYLDISLSFDLVIFDEASQIFVEDALPSIVRGKQVIIAGDSKQLPPCDFFKAGDITRDDEESYLEEEMKIGPSLLDVASSYLSDSFISLSWHYRSQDESLISFANDYMEYGLITFPSSYHNPNHGIRYHFVPYHEDTCYDEGKSGSHTNIGEAEKIVNILYSEMCHPERKDFSLGVVAFSNAQALKIEEMWEDYKSDPSRRPIIEAYEVRHANEPIVFCNLDTMQGDERDTMLVSTCYGKGKDGRFLLSYLGRIRLESGKKRINVAITRARKQMVVVTSLEEDALNRLIASSLSMEENISGAKMLSAFLSYARSGGQKRLNAPLGFKSTTRFTEALCRLLDQNDIPYVCDVGDSDCKVNIAIPCSFDHSSYCLGIIIDDPRRPDFDSPREYARLTEQILRDRYGWKIYRVFPYGFFLDYESASRILLEKIEKERR